MISSILPCAHVRNGNAHPCVATPAGLDVLDAAYHTVHGYPGGVPALAQRMAMSQNTLAHKVSLNNATHHLSLRESIAVQAFSGDFRILHAMAAALGHVAISQHLAGAPTSMQDFVRLAQEFADLTSSISRTVADNKVTHNEMMECEQRAAELFAATNAMLTTLRSMMPPAPGDMQ